MISKERILSALFLQVSCVILTISTGIFGAAPLLLLRRTTDALNFLFLQFLTITIALYFKSHLLALTLFSLGFLVFCYGYLEKKPILFRSVISVLISSTIFLVTLYCWIYFKGSLDFWTWMGDKVELYFSQARTILGDVKMDLESLTYQVPSLVVMFFALALWIAVLFDARSQRRFGVVKPQIEIKNFRTPEAFIWVVIVSLLFSFVKTPVPGLQEAALNILNISLLLYFFQGLSVLSYLMEILSFGSLLKMIVYFIFIAQLLLPICLGILDFWLNFRNKISKKDSRV